MSQQESKTLRRAIAGDRLAFRTLVLEHSAAQFRLAWRLTRDEHLAEDVVQEAFLKAYRNIGRFNRESGFATWMHRITVNTAMDLLRKQSRRDRHETAEPDWESSAAAGPDLDPGIERREEIRRHTEAAMEELTDLERAAFTLRHYEGHSIAEICSILEMKDNACKQAIFRAVRKLRGALQPLVNT